MAMPGGRVGKAVLELATEQSQYEAGIATARGVLQRFQADVKKVTFRDLTQGMSAAGRQASASSRLIAGMGEAGRKSAATQVAAFTASSKAAAWAAARNADLALSARHAAAASQTFGQRLQGIQGGLAASAKNLVATAKGFGLFGAALSASAIFGAARSVGQFASHMEDLSAETGVGVERLQAFNFAGAAVGLTIDNLTDLMNQLTRRVASGDDSAVGALNRLGISADKFVSSSADERVFMLADAFGQLTDETERTNRAMDLFGTRSGPRALRILNGELRTLIEQIEKSGAVLDKELIAKAARFDNFWSQAWIRFRAESVRAIDALIQGIDTATERSAGLAGTLVNAVQAARGLSDEVARMAANVPEKPGTPAQAKPAGIPGESDLKELDRRVDDAVDRQRKAEQDRLEAARKAEQDRLQKMRELQQESERNMREYQSALREDIEARARFARFAEGLIEEQNEIEREAAAEFERARKADLEAIIQFEDEATEAYRNISDERNAIGLSFMEADIKRLDEQRQRLDEMREYWRRFGDDLAYSFAGNLAEMAVGLQGFKDGFIGIWRDIRRAIAGILADMVADVIKHYIKRVLAELAKAKLAKAFLAGSEQGGGGGGGGSQWAQLASGLFMNQGPGGGGGGGGIPGGPGPAVGIAKQLAPLLATYGPGIGAGAGVGYLVGNKTGSTAKGMLSGGAAGAGVGFAFGGPIGAGIGFGVGLFAGWLGAQKAQKAANRLRDQFLMANWGGTREQAGPRAAAWLTQQTKQAGGGPLYANLIKAKTVGQVRESQQAIAMLAQSLGRRVQMFRMGGFVPPGVTMPAVLHGGHKGEVVVPLDKLQRRPSDQQATQQRPQIVIHAPLHVNGGIVSPDTLSELHRKHIVRLNNEALIYNKGGSATETRRVVAGRV